MVGMPSDPFAKDLQFDPATARARAAGRGLRPGLSRRVARARAPLRSASSAGTKYLGTVDYVSPLLKRTVKRKPAVWQLVPFHFDVYALS